MRALAVLICLALSSVAEAEEQLTPDTTVYLGAFAFNVSNFEPVIFRDCVPIRAIDSKKALTATVADLETGGAMRCEKRDDILGYACKNDELGIVGRVDVIKSLSECKEYPKKLVKQLKTLLNRP